MLKEVMTAEFEELFDKGVVLVDFFSATCGPCKMLSFVLNDVEKALGDKVTILKVNFDENKDLTETSLIVNEEIKDVVAGSNILGEISLIIESK